MTSQKEIQSLFSYDKNTGIFTWRKDRYARKVKGLEAGWTVSDKNRRTKYINMRVNGVIHKAHRLAWMYVYGEWPEYIDHDDGNGLNNRISNLRNVSKEESAKNKPLQLNNKSGCSGVRFYKPLEKWLARINVNRKRVHLGYFDLIEDAIKARKEA